ncbi:MAG: methyltransferase domain-containing protein [Chloroflexi bacterium AL-W]|nr:methyltransferase domain-containing protein [Chloroflexi bacterium AL-N1]NOK69324.1 methyltransferase domain-containing protein [Chloroflexi bacterium AL-N10]NOK76385.1 methyltransferase domain-containing protein [Chloroflexi bacterium AL-N5]NOK83502.1 methyltransferase domain-containing protein [Chloroflexi bacterium AL-W]NOK91162.1 methyltransferase domain-containing protein [Chloroflexi bacterium AL-N15]
MDKQTLHAYEQNAPLRCERYRLILPTEILQHALTLFHHGKETADIGCGSGRDVHWLNTRSFPTVGYDASPTMRTEARQAYPTIDVRTAVLPHLSEIPDCTYYNVLSIATIMHLTQNDIPTALHHLARILHTNGRLLLSYRSSSEYNEREADGRLFTALSTTTCTAMLEAAGFCINTTSEQHDPYRERIRWFIFLATRQ